MSIIEKCAFLLVCALVLRMASEDAFALNDTVRCREVTAIMNADPADQKARIEITNYSFWTLSTLDASLDLKTKAKIALVALFPYCEKAPDSTLKAELESAYTSYRAALNAQQKKRP
jgi:hypothetical protein